MTGRPRRGPGRRAPPRSFPTSAAPTSKRTNCATKMMRHIAARRTAAAANFDTHGLRRRERGRHAADGVRPGVTGRAAAKALRRRRAPRQGNRPGRSDASAGCRGIGDRIVDQCLDPGGAQCGLQRVARRAEHREEVIDVAGVELAAGRRPRRRREPLRGIGARARGAVRSTPAAAATGRAAPPPASRRAASSRRTPRGDSDPSVRRFAGAAPRGERRIVRRDRSAVAECAEVLRRIEAVGGCGAEGADRPPVTGRQMRLAAVLDDGEIVARGDRDRSPACPPAGRRDAPA